MPFRNSSVLGNKVRSASTFDSTLPSGQHSYQFMTASAAIGGSGEMDGANPTSYHNQDGIRVFDHLERNSGLKQRLTRHCGKYGTDISLSLIHI